MVDPQTRANRVAEDASRVTVPLDQEGDGLARAIGLGLITGAADDDPSAIGTYASAGAKFGPALLWMAPVTFPMMFAVRSLALAVLIWSRVLRLLVRYRRPNQTVHLSDPLYFRFDDTHLAFTMPPAAIRMRDCWKHLLATLDRLG